MLHMPSMINVWTKYGEPRFNGYGETDIITKNLILLMLPPEQEYCLICDPGETNTAENQQEWSYNHTRLKKIKQHNTSSFQIDCTAFWRDEETLFDLYNIYKPFTTNFFHYFSWCSPHINVVKCSLPVERLPNRPDPSSVCFPGNVLFMTLFTSWVQNNIGGVMARVLTLSAIEHGLEPPSGQTKDR